MLAKSTSQLAARLPRINMLSKLYATQDMRKAVESLYSCILKFLLTAHSWVNESKFRHFYHSVTRPPKLQYEGLLDEITTCSNNIFELAALGSQAEIRVMHTSQAQKLDDVLSVLQAADKERESHRDGFARIVSRLEISERSHEKKLDMIISLLEASGLTIEQLLLKTESEFSSDNRWPRVG